MNRKRDTTRPWLVCGLTALVLLPLAVGAAIDSADSGPSVAVTTVMPNRQNFSEIMSGYGSIEADPRTALALSLPQGVRVAQVLTTPGARVAAGQVLLRLQPDPAGRLAYEQARHELGLAKATLKQTQTLYDQRLATQSQLDSARKTLADAQTNLATQRALGGGGTSNVLKAPAAGVVQSLTVTTGQRVAAGTTLLQLAPTQQRLARIGIEPGDAARIKPAQPVTLTPAFGGAALQGQVAQLSNAINPQTRLVDILVTLPTSATLPLGSEVSAQIQSGKISVWAVPRGAVLSDDKGAYLFQDDHGVARRVDVKLVQPDGGTVGVDGPLDRKLPVIVLGVYELSDGMRVRKQQ